MNNIIQNHEKYKNSEMTDTTGFRLTTGLMLTIDGERFRVLDVYPTETILCRIDGEKFCTRILLLVLITRMILLDVQSYMQSETYFHVRSLLYLSHSIIMQILEQ